MGDDLTTIQARFFRLVGQPAPVGDAARALSDEDAGAHPLKQWIAARDEDEATMRLDVYAQMYFARLRDSLREDYPALEAVLGADAFEQIIADYLVAHPSDRPSLHDLGRHMPAFVAEHPLAAHRGDARDLAALEWARLAVFGAVDVVPIEEGDLASVLPERLGEMEIVAIAALRLLEGSHRVDGVWRAVDRGETAPPSDPTPTATLVWRRGFVVRHRVVDAAEQRALRLLISGARIDAICEALIEGDAATLEDAAQRAFATMRQWIADGIVAPAR